MKQVNYGKSFRMKKLFLAALFSSTSLFAQNWDMNDVSYLFSLPKKGESDFLLMPSSKGPRGDLFPKRLDIHFKELIISYDAPEDSFRELRVVGMRIDPCFIYTTAQNEKCQPQIRLVWQPLKEMEDLYSTYDAAAHSFYDLSEAEFKNLSKELQNLKSKYKVITRGLPLSIHPAMTNEKTRVAFANDLKTIILKYAGEKNLKRFTFMQFLTKDIWWRFGGFDILADGTTKSLTIPRLKNADEPLQDFFNEDPLNDIGMRGTIMPFMRDFNDNLSDYVTAYGISNTENGKRKLADAFKIINRIENPRIHNTATMDCVHCHIASPSRFWLETKFSHLMPEIVKNVDHYVQDFLFIKNLQNPNFNKKKNKSIRSFGYFDEKPSVNQRTINETSVVVEDMNRLRY